MAVGPNHMIRALMTWKSMHAEINHRVAMDRHLAAEEARFPTLNQTVARLEAQRYMKSQIQALRNDGTRSIMSKQVEKSNIAAAEPAPIATCASAATKKKGDKKKNKSRK
ncbi:hypothetical protein KVT40_007379 [Elsinoe batatas]|uniref:Uncharacterized protein n=1 Tax=Elsinoe batatas TaxID=2601811 RepID=A0A8K0KVI6_9PEZI|nr:hypothetical protein KVT40_007379 [Elsinoe batatas]